VSGIELNDINKMEREFLAGIGFKPLCGQGDACLLGWSLGGPRDGKGKERGSRQWCRSRQTPRAATVAQLVASLILPSKGNTLFARA
jgi:hypothetical protein